MTNLATLRTRLSSELGDSDTINKTQEQRDQAINDACTQVYEYRKWPEVYINTTTQAVDSQIVIPFNYDTNTALWFGKNQDYGLNNIQFVNQTDFFVNNPFQATITEENGLQVIKLSQEPDQGHDTVQKVSDATIGINDIAAQERIGNTFVPNSDVLEGALLKLNKVGAPTGMLTIEIFATAAGLPTGAPLATGTINLNNIVSTSQYHWVKFSNSLSVTIGDTYAITATASYTTSATDYISWDYSTTDQITGNQIIFDGVSWAAGVGDQAFVTATDYYNFQYVKTFITMVESTDDNGLTSKFDQAITKMAAGIIWETKGKDDRSAAKFWGVGGNQRSPAQNSAFGLLDLIWDNVRFNTLRPRRRLKSIYEQDSQYYRYRINNFTRS